MKFDLAINLERISGNLEMPAVVKHTLDMVQMAEAVSYTHLTLPTTPNV